MCPGPILDMILQQIKEDDKDKFRNKVHAEEEALDKSRVERGEMTRDQAMRAKADRQSQFDLEYEERILGPDSDNKKPEKADEKPGDGTEVFSKFMEQFR
jgi:hypothetical protein